MIEQTGFPQRVENLVFSPDGRYLAFAGHQGVVNLWNLEDRSLREWQSPSSSATEFCAIAFIDNASELLIVNRNSIRILNLDSWACRQLVTNSKITAAFVHPDGDRIYTTGPNVVRCHRLSGMKEVWSVSREFGEYNVMAYQGISDRLFLGGASHPVELRRASDGILIDRIRSPRYPVYRIRFSHDERLSVLCLTTECVVLEGEKFRPIATLKTNTGKYFTDCEFHPLAPNFASTANDGAVRLWDTENWTERIAYTWDIGPMRSVCFAPDGMRMAAGTGDGRVIVWDVDL